MERFGRSIQAYCLQEKPFLVVIDILQKDGDCPHNLAREQRRTCPLDCQDRYMMFVYDSLEGRIVREAMLYVDTIRLHGSALRKHNIDPDDFNTFFMRHKAEVSYTRHPTKSDINYGGDKIGELTPCKFLFGEEIAPSCEEQRICANLVRDNPKKVIEECGIKIGEIRPKNLPDAIPVSVLALRSPENIRSIKDLNSFLKAG